MGSTPPPGPEQNATIPQLGVDDTISSDEHPALPREPLPRGSGAVGATSARGHETVLPKVTEVDGTVRLVLEQRPRFAPISALGAGGMGEVNLVQDQDIGRKVAIKRLRPDQRGSDSLARFADEVRTVGRLEHPNIVPIHDVGVDEAGHHFFVMKYVEGETLETIIARLSAGEPEHMVRYTYSHRIQICMELLRAVEHAHARGIIHRDLKPANIMVGARGEVMLMDWGLAKPAGGKDSARGLAGAEAPPTGESLRQATQQGTLLGTPAYMSPEQARGEHDALDERSDIYSLGVIFYELFTLQHPRAAQHSVVELIVAVINEPITRAQLIRAFSAVGAPAAILHFLVPALAQRPEDRHPSVAVMLTRLEAIREGRIPIQCHVTFLTRVTHEFGRLVNTYPTLALFGLVTVAILSLGGIVAAIRHALTG